MQETEQNTDYSGKTWATGKAEPISPEYQHLQGNLCKGVTSNGPEEGCSSGRSISQMVQLHHPGEIGTYYQGWP